jgi:tetratricopeptide (TPR) repeat protein
MFTAAEAAEAAEAAVDIRCPLRSDRRRLIGCRQRHNPIFNTGLVAALIVAVLAEIFGAIPAAQAGESSAAGSEACLAASGSTAVAVCRDALGREPRNSAVRTALSNALVQSRNFDQAVAVLQDGVALEPGNGDIKVQLIKVEQLRDEQRWIEKQKQQRESAPATGMSSRQRVEAERMQIRCTKLTGRTALEACNEGLARFPGNVAFYVGKGDALMGLARYGEALEAYEAARAVEPANADIQRAMVKARALRQVNLKECMELTGSTALAGCSAALQKGGRDEAAVRERQGDLLDAAGQKSEAAAAYRAALSAGGGNQGVAAKLRALGALGAGNPQPGQTALKPVAVVQKPAPAPPAPAVRKPQAPPAPTVPVRPMRAPKPAPRTMAMAKPEMGGSMMVKPPMASPADAGPPPAPVQKQPVTYSNAPLPSGFTH